MNVTTGPFDSRLESAIQLAESFSGFSKFHVSYRPLFKKLWLQQDPKKCGSITLEGCEEFAQGMVDAGWSDWAPSEKERRLWAACAKSTKGNTVTLEQFCEISENADFDPNALDDARNDDQETTTTQMKVEGTTLKNEAGCAIDALLPPDVIGVVAEFSAPNSVWSLRSTSNKFRSKIRHSCSEKWNPILVIVGDSRVLVYKYFWGTHDLMKCGETPGGIPQLQTGGGFHNIQMKKMYDPLDDFFDQAHHGIPCREFYQQVCNVLYASPDFLLSSEDDQNRWEALEKERETHSTGAEDNARKAKDHFLNAACCGSSSSSSPIVYLEGFLVGDTTPLRNAFQGNLIFEPNQDLLLPFMPDPGPHANHSSHMYKFVVPGAQGGGRGSHGPGAYRIEHVVKRLRRLPKLNVVESPVAAAMERENPLQSGLPGALHMPPPPPQEYQLQQQYQQPPQQQQQYQPPSQVQQQYQQPPQQQQQYQQPSQLQQQYQQPALDPSAGAPQPPQPWPPQPPQPLVHRKGVTKTKTRDNEGNVMRANRPPNSLSPVTQEEAEAVAPLAALQGYIRYSCSTTAHTFPSIHEAAKEVGFLGFDASVGALLGAEPSEDDDLTALRPFDPYQAKPVPATKEDMELYKERLTKYCPSFAQYLALRGGGNGKDPTPVRDWPLRASVKEVGTWNEAAWREHLGCPFIVSSPEAPPKALAPVKHGVAEDAAMWREEGRLAVGKNLLSGGKLQLNSHDVQQIYVESLFQDPLKNRSMYAIDQEFLFKKCFCPKVAEREGALESDAANKKATAEFQQPRMMLRQPATKSNPAQWRSKFLNPTLYVHSTNSTLYKHVAVPMPSFTEAQATKLMAAVEKGTDRLPIETPWLIVGSKDSYCAEHKEPAGSNTWAHLLHGNQEGKLWYLQLPDEATGTLTWFKLVQEEGETVFLPPTIRHFVVNPKGSLSVSRNFLIRPAQ